jgi:hypothetical protein
MSDNDQKTVRKISGEITRLRRTIESPYNTDSIGILQAELYHQKNHLSLLITRVLMTVMKC